MRLFLLFIFLTATQYIFAVSTNISGIVNSYAQVTAVGTNTITTNTFLPAKTIVCGDRIMIIQMKGASISTANNTSFGNITAINNAGNYEVHTVESASGSVLTLSANLINSYSVVFGTLQVVYIPRYEDAIITGTLTASPWDGMRGGICAIEVDGSLTMNAGIDVDELGFRGGDFHLSSQAAPSAVNCFFTAQNGNVGSNYGYTNANRQFAVEKGESVVQTTLLWGKGKLASGGGGGGIESGGGGGGSNYGAGGNAGGGNPASTFAFCTMPDVAGKGGLSLNTTIATNRLFLGGGSGAGNNGNTNSYFTGSAEAGPAQGRDGGGIVYVSANEIVGNGNLISANGEDGYTPPASINNFGGAGGGGGGAILLDCDIYNTALTVEAQGGFGSTVRVTSNSTRRRGAGGGGGGGYAWFSTGSTPVGVTVNTAGGAAGLSYTNTNTLSPSHYGTVGAAGTSLFNLNVNGTDHIHPSLVTSTATKTNVINGANLSFTDNGLIAKVDPMGNNLGSTAVSVTVGSTGPFAGSIGCPSNEDEHYMPRVYTISPTNQPSSPCLVSLFVTQTELTNFISFTNGLGATYDNCWGAVNSINDLIVTAHHSSGTKEVLIPTPTYLPCADAWQLDVAVSEFSTFYIHSNAGLLTNNLLPVELLNFEAKNIGSNSIMLEWSTTTEIDNKGFYIMRSDNGYEFETLGFVQGHGNSTSQIDYQYLDDIEKTARMQDYLYYQLKQIDYNEQFANSSIEVVTIQKAEILNTLKVFPNPTDGKVNIESSDEAMQSIQLIDHTGRILASYNPENRKSFEINIAEMNPGNYFLRITLTRGVVTSKILVKE